jgi:putative ABC transport system permease protein
MNLFRHRALALLAIGAVAASAALATGVEIASRGVRRELFRAASALTGTADLELVASERGLPEALLARVKQVPGVAAASPIVAETVRIATAEPAGLPLHVLGLDLLDERKSHDFEVVRNQVTVRDPLSLLARPNALVVSALLAERLALEIGDPLRVRTPTGTHVLSIEGLISQGDFARAYGGRIAVMDIFALQRLAGSEGFFDKIEIVADPERSDGLQARLAQSVGDVADVRAATAAQQSVIRGALGMLDLLLWGVPALAVIVAALLAYAAVAQLVRSRLRWIALMQCAGMGSRGIWALVLADALLLSALGTALGFIGGIYLSPLLVRSLSQLSQLLGDLTLEETTLSPGTLGVAAVVWLAVGVLAAWKPAREAAGRRPLEMLTAMPPPGGQSRAARGRLVYAALGSVALAALCFDAAPIPARVRAAGVLLLGLSVLAVSGGEALRWVALRALPWLGRVPRLGPLLGRSILARPEVSGISLTAIAVVVGFLVALLTTVQSVISSMDEWVAVRFADSIAVFAGAPNTGFGGEPIMPETLEQMRRVPGVEDLAPMASAFVRFGGHEVIAQAVPARVFLRRRAFFPRDTPPEELAAALERGEVAVSYAFSRFFGKPVGSTVELRTRHGMRAFRVGGLIRSYVGPEGSMLFDLATFDAHFGQEGASMARIWSRSPFDELERALQARAGQLQPLFFSHGEAARRMATETLTWFHSLVDVVVALSAFFCAVALLNLLTGGVASRRRDLAIMQLAGARPFEVALAVFADAALLAAAGVCAGVLLGLAGGRVVADVFFEQLGWFIDHSPHPGTIAAPAAALFAACALMGFVAALRARRSTPADVLRAS